MPVSSMCDRQLQLFAIATDVTAASTGITFKMSKNLLASHFEKLFPMQSFENIYISFAAVLNT